MKIKTMIVEDERPAREEIRYLLGKRKNFEIICEAEDGNSALKFLDSYKNEIDLLFLDIKIPGISGIEIARKLQKAETSPYIIFTTAYDEHAVEAFKLSALDYLLKPFSDERFNDGLLKAEKKIKKGIKMNEQMDNLIKYLADERKENNLSKIAVEDRDYYLMLDFKDIYYFATNEKKVWAYSRQNSYMTQFRLKELEKILPEYFFRIHKSYIVNLKNIKAVIPWFKGKYQVLMENYSEHKIPVSRSKVAELNERLNLK
ncbi:MAG: LytR/AlgR family response regulator transcription factor [Halanaerobium sp.]